MIRLYTLKETSKLLSVSVKIIKRRRYYDPETVYKIVCKKVRKTVEKGVEVDYISFVPDGEPTLDINIGREIYLPNSIGIKIADTTN